MIILQSERLSHSFVLGLIFVADWAFATVNNLSVLRLPSPSWPTCCVPKDSSRSLRNWLVILVKGVIIKVFSDSKPGEEYESAESELEDIYFSTIKTDELQMLKETA